MTVDTAGNIYIATNGDATNAPAIFVFGPTANGAATPIRTISGSLTQIISPYQFALDAAGDLYAVMANDAFAGVPPILVMYPAGSSGNVAPTMITSSQYAPGGVALDSAGNIYITSGSGTTASPYGIYEFAAGSKAGAAPTRSITGTNVQGADEYLQVDTAGNIFVSGFFGSESYLYGESIFVYGATASATSHRSPRSLHIGQPMHVLP